MKFKDYIPLAMRTCKVLPEHEHIAHMVIGVAGELGEIIDAVKKHKIYGKKLDEVNLLEEVSDVLWYCAGLAKYSSTQELFDAAPAAPLEDNLINIVLNFNCKISEQCYHINRATNTSKLYDITTYVDTLFILVKSLADSLNVDIGEACDKNVAKLSKRYGGAYSDHAATHRDLQAERKVLEV